MKKKLTLALLTTMTLTGCLSSDDDDDGDTASQSYSFPAVAITSPTASSASAGIMSFASSNVSISSTGYSSALETINDIIDGSATVSGSFDPTLFLQGPMTADCFGPSLAYQDHPDGSTPNSGTLPTGDLGIWQETEADGEVCAAAQLNAQLKGVSDASNMALISLASLIQVANDNSLAVPTAGTSLNLTTEMNALSISSTTFTQASISQSLSGQWSYDLSFTYLDSSSHDIAVSLTHDPSSSDNYEGLLTYMVDDFFDPAGNCPITSGTGADITYNGSLHYILDDANSLRFQQRYASLCGHGQSGLSEALSSSTVSGSVLSPSSSWRNNFSIFTAELDPNDMSGSYSYTWQAGDGDSDSRIFNLGLNPHTPQDGESYFGYGPRVQSATDGTIDGFYCNWAGPGNSHSKLDYAQRQHITYNSSTGQFEPSNSGASDITYAPTDSCLYDGTGSFAYDRNQDGLLNDDISQLMVTDPATSGLGLDLMDKMSYSDITESIDNRGYDAPNYP